MCEKFQLSISDSSRDIKGVPNFTTGCQMFTQTSPSFWGHKFMHFWALTEEGPSYYTKAAIADEKFRCKVIRHLMSNSLSEMPIFGGFWVIFLWG